MNSNVIHLNDSPLYSNVIDDPLGVVNDVEDVIISVA